MPNKVLGVKISQKSKEESREEVKKFLESDSQHMIFTPNAEMLVDARKDDYFQEILNDASLNLCDSKGVNFFTFNSFERITGTDFMLDILEIAEKKNKSVYFLGSGSDKVTKNLEEKMEKQFPNLNIVGSHPGPKIELKQVENINKLGIDKNKNDKILHEILMKSPDILFVAFGHIKQELWIHAYLDELPGVKLAMGIGGAFDYHSGKTERAPKWVRNLGFEWLYRVFKEPARIGRIFKAVVVFPIVKLFNKLIN
jgi:N-acetylglucosaminyldiphosphoundecaprenol N-acetyl-beta-D-mannosaminyltransferase